MTTVENMKTLKRFSFNATEEQLAEWAAVAASEGMSLAAWLRSLAIKAAKAAHKK